MTPTCRHCRHAKPWLVHGGVHVECLAKGERGYAWDIERQCGQFERKSLEPLGNQPRRYRNHDG
ncbi:hypothetical protein [Nitrosococcus wardiae]|uniref:Uncharacterized protein n=1 Tax=Nitrosococcus wardiae TaxID=1814290 RepID=A0A4P7C4J2_9GAMM|nr:hypothetical protein [Nitrosococcus wardiae]QBQ55782.1 hypothetical protein E3U44_15630 [Nitrosococcus wardiae]